MIPPGYGTRLKRLRINKGYTQEEVANQLELSRDTIHNYESELSHPSGDALYDLAALYGVSIDMITGEPSNNGRLLVDLSLLPERTRVAFEQMFFSIVDDIEKITSDTE